MTVNSYRMRASFAILVCWVLAITGCVRDEPKQPAATPPPAGRPAELPEFTFVWTAEPGIDLVTDGAAIAARAYTESYYLASITKNEKYLYPGFADAVEPDQPEGPPDKHELHPEIGNADPSVWVGTLRHHVLSIDRSGRGVILTACAYVYGTARPVPNSEEYTANIGPDYDLNSGIYPMQIGFRAPSDSGSKSLTQEGPAKAPYNNVFGGWKTTSFLSDYMTDTKSWTEKEGILAACIANADGPPESRHFIPRRLYPRSDFPTLPATPGWPDKPTS
jgi:hypothetical protein